MVNNDFMNILKILAPGTAFREGLDNILKAKTGALILISDLEEAQEVVDGGFYINQEYMPANIYELAKMDGAIVISKDLKKIYYANTQLIPDNSIPTFETGTRHRTAERVAKQTNELVICISQRRGIITIFKGNMRYLLDDVGTVLVRANQAIQTLEKYKMVLDETLAQMNQLEFDDVVSLENVINTIHRFEAVMRMSEEVERHVIELGSEGRLIKMQLDELINNIKEDEYYMIQDYIVDYEDNLNNTTKRVLGMIREIDYDRLVNNELIAKIFGYDSVDDISDFFVSPRGYRILNKIPKMPTNIINNLVNEFTSLQGIVFATLDELDDVEGIGEIRAKNIKQSLRRMKEQANIEM